MVLLMQHSSRVSPSLRRAIVRCTRLEPLYVRLIRRGPFESRRPLLPFCNGLTHRLPLLTLVLPTFLLSLLLIRHAFLPSLSAQVMELMQEVMMCGILRPD